MEPAKQSKKEFICAYDGCLKKFSSKSHLNRHKNFHIGKIYRCEDCDATFRTQYNHKRHVDNKHLKKAPKKYVCEHCEESFNKKSWLNRHAFEHTGIKPYVCTFKNCGARFLIPSKLKRHLKVHEGYPCPKENCKEKFAKWTDVRRHLKLIHPKVYKCPECDQAFSRSNNLKSHLEIHKSNRCVFMCFYSGCYRFYSTRSNLMGHITSHHMKKTGNCTAEQCCNTSNSHCDYCKGHFNKAPMSNSSKPYVCTFENCNARFLVPSKLKKHMNVHEGYACPKENCNEKFSKWTDVRTHLKLVHPKAYKCPDCDQEFSTYKRLKAHLVIHVTDRRVFLCSKEGCHRFYFRMSNLIHHAKHYHEKRPYDCTVEQCHKSFKSQEDLKTHISTHNSPGRLKKKKKKNKSNPNFAERLAGLVPHKWQLDVLNGVFDSAVTKSCTETSSELNSMENHSDSQHENTAKTHEILVSTVDGSCVNALYLTSDDEANNNVPNSNVNDDNDSDCCAQNSDVDCCQLLVSTVYGGCDNALCLTSGDEANNSAPNSNVNDDSDSDCCAQNSDIQKLLNLIEKRKDFETENVTQDINSISIGV